MIALRALYAYRREPDRALLYPDDENRGCWNIVAELGIW